MVDQCRLNAVFGSGSNSTQRPRQFTFHWKFETKTDQFWIDLTEHTLLIATRSVCGEITISVSARWLGGYLKLFTAVFEPRVYKLFPVNTFLMNAGEAFLRAGTVNGAKRSSKVGSTRGLPVDPNLHICKLGTLCNIANVWETFVEFVGSAHFGHLHPGTRNQTLTQRHRLKSTALKQLWGVCSYKHGNIFRTQNWSSRVRVGRRLQTLSQLHHFECLHDGGQDRERT